MSRSWFFVNMFDYTRNGMDARFRRVCEITRSALDIQRPKSYDLWMDLGKFRTLEAARKALVDHAGDVGLRLIQSADDASPDADLVETYRYARYGLLTDLGTRSRYADWACKIACNFDPETFAEHVAKARRDAVDGKLPIPCTHALLAQIRAYRAEMLEEEIEREED